MSVHRVPKAKGGGWEVRWRQGTRHRSRTFHARDDAQAFDDHLRRQRRLGALADLDAGTELLADFGADWWSRHRDRLAASTRKRGAEVWDGDVLPALGDYHQRQLNAGVIEDELAVPMRAPAVGLATVRKALYMVRSCLAYAVRRELLPYNPARDVALPKGTRRTVRPLAPVAVEAMRAELGLRDATLLSVMYGAGLRPGEALALRDDSIRERTLLVDRSVSFGAEKDTKTRRARTVRLLAPIAQDLAAYRLATAKERLGSRYLFPRPDGGPWRDTDFRNWRRRTFQTAAAEAGVATVHLEPLPDGRKRRRYDGPRPYDLRHTFVSLLAQEGRSLAYTAAQAGHSVEECARTYTHLFEEYEDAPPVPADELIRQARRDVEERKAI